MTDRDAARAAIAAAMQDAGLKVDIRHAPEGGLRAWMTSYDDRLEEADVVIAGWDPEQGAPDSDMERRVRAQISAHRLYHRNVAKYRDAAIAGHAAFRRVVEEAGSPFPVEGWRVARKNQIVNLCIDIVIWGGNAVARRNVQTFGLDRTAHNRFVDVIDPARIAHVAAKAAQVLVPRQRAASETHGRPPVLTTPAEIDLTRYSIQKPFLAMIRDLGHDRPGDVLRHMIHKGGAGNAPTIDGVHLPDVRAYKVRDMTIGGRLRLGDAVDWANGEIVVSRTNLPETLRQSMNLLRADQIVSHPWIDDSMTVAGMNRGTNKDGLDTNSIRVNDHVVAIPEDMLN